MYDLSILIPGIRTINWQQVLDTVRESCKRYTYEIVFAGPFDPPATLDMTNIKYTKTYACPSSAGQIGSKLCSGKLLYHAVDDAKFIPNAIDLAIDLYHQQCGHKDVVNMRYTENDNYSGVTFPPEFWYAHHHTPLRLAGIPTSYKLALHFLINREYFMELGGFDCKWEYMNFNLHDLMFRVQHEGGRIFDSPTDVTNCNHYGNRAIDHGAIEDAYPNDLALFVNKYNDPAALQKSGTRIDIDNWKQQPEVWARRFATKLFTSYEEMIS